MKKVILVLLAVLFSALAWNNVKADPNVYISAYSIDTTCTGTCGDKTELYNEAVAIGMNVGYVGAEVIFANNDSGASIYLQAKPLNGLRVYAGASHLPDTALVDVPGYGTFQDSDNVSALLLGIDYKILSVRYYNYDANHSVTKQAYDKVTKTYINQQTGNTSNNKESVWIGLTFKY